VIPYSLGRRDTLLTSTVQTVTFGYWMASLRRRGSRNLHLRHLSVRNTERSAALHLSCTCDTASVKSRRGSGVPTKSRENRLAQACPPLSTRRVSGRTAQGGRHRQRSEWRKGQRRPAQRHVRRRTCECHVLMPLSRADTGTRSAENVTVGQLRLLAPSAQTRAACAPTLATIEGTPSGTVAD
jgi:hypothetical protein